MASQALQGEHWKLFRTVTLNSFSFGSTCLLGHSKVGLRSRSHSSTPPVFPGAMPVAQPPVPHFQRRRRRCYPNHGVMDILRENHISVPEFKNIGFILRTCLERLKTSVGVVAQIIWCVGNGARSYHTATRQSVGAGNLHDYIRSHDGKLRSVLCLLCI